MWFSSNCSQLFPGRPPPPAALGAQGHLTALESRSCLPSRLAHPPRRGRRLPRARPAPLGRGQSRRAPANRSRGPPSRGAARLACAGARGDPSGNYARDPGHGRRRGRGTAARGRLRRLLPDGRPRRARGGREGGFGRVDRVCLASGGGEGARAGGQDGDPRRGGPAAGHATAGKGGGVAAQTPADRRSGPGPRRRLRRRTKIEPRRSPMSIHTPRRSTPNTP